MQNRLDIVKKLLDHTFVYLNETRKVFKGESVHPEHVDEITYCVENTLLDVSEILFSGSKSDVSRDQLEDEIHEYFEREYCEGGDGLEMLVSRLSDSQIIDLHRDLVGWFGTLEEIRPEGEAA